MNFADVFYTTPVGIYRVQIPGKQFYKLIRVVVICCSR